MKKPVKTNEITGAALDWVVAKCQGIGIGPRGWVVYYHEGEPAMWQPSTDWAQGGPIIEREGISIIRLDDEDIPDAEGFWTGEKLPQWGAVAGDEHSLKKQHGSQGDYFGTAYPVDEDAVIGNTPLIAAMRCYVASKLGDTVEIPEELL